MTTVVVTTSWPRSADPIAGVFVFDDAVARARRGDRVIVASPAGPGDPAHEVGVEAVDVPHAGLFGSPGATLRLRRAPWRWAGLAPWRRAVLEVIEAHRPTQIVAHWLVPTGWMLATAATTATIEAIAHGGDVRLLEALPRPLARRLLERIADRASILRAVSPDLARRLAAIAPRLARSIVVAPMPLALERSDVLERVRARAQVLRASIDAPFAVVVSRLVDTKPIDRAIASAAAACRDVVVVGDGPRLRTLRRRARDRGDRIRFVGAVEHEEALAWIAASAHVAVAKAHGEGAPTVAREADFLGVSASIVDAAAR